MYVNLLKVSSGGIYQRKQKLVLSDKLLGFFDYVIISCSNLCIDKHSWGSRIITMNPVRYLEGNICDLLKKSLILTYNSVLFKSLPGYHT